MGTCRLGHSRLSVSAGTAAKHLCTVGSDVCSRQLVGTACFGIERLLAYVPECAAGTWSAKRASSTVVAFYCLPDCSAQGSLPLFTSACFRCCSSWWADWVQAGLVTGWLGDGRLGYREGVTASGTVACAKSRWLAQHARMQSLRTRVFAHECSPASLHFCVFGAGGSERVHGATLDESAGGWAECVCSAVFHAQG